MQALALCSFLDNNRHVVDMQGKEVLELGAGTGLVTIVASLLGVYFFFFTYRNGSCSMFMHLPSRMAKASL